MTMNSELVGKKHMLMEALRIPSPTTERFTKSEFINMGAI